MLQIWLDDVRNPPDETWLVFRTAEDLITFLKTNKDEIACLSLDHDLGEGRMTGYGAISWIEERVVEGLMVPPLKMLIHSANPVGAKRISQAIESIQRFAY